MRKLREDDIQIIVTPRREGDFGWVSMGVRDPDSNARHMMGEAERIMGEIRRHVADFADVRVESKTVTVCGSDPWRVDADGNSTRWWPECCDVDQQEYFDLHAHSHNRRLTGELRCDCGDVLRPTPRVDDRAAFEARVRAGHNCGQEVCTHAFND